MPKLDLPPDSLGPKPTKKQLETLTTLTKEGIYVHEWSGVRMDWYANLYDGASMNETFNRNTLGKFVDYGWVEQFGDADWKSRNYRISERGKKVVEKGEFRK